MYSQQIDVYSMKLLVESNNFLYIASQKKTTDDDCTSAELIVYNYDSVLNSFWCA